MSAAMVASARHLLGLSQQEFADALSVSRHTVKDWESGRLAVRSTLILDISRLIAEHDEDTRALGSTDPVVLPSGPKPRGWYAAVGARILAQDTAVDLRWES